MTRRWFGAAVAVGVIGAAAWLLGASGASAATCTIVGTSGDDVLRGTPGPDVICAKDGDDLLVGQRGDDVLIGGDGSDTLRPGLGDDRALGGAGTDQVRYSDLPSSLHVRVDLVAQTAQGGGSDELSGVEGATGTRGDDTLKGTDGPNVLGGLGGDDLVVGADGNDVLFGRSGEDVLRAGDGVNTVYGGSGDDLLTSGVDADVLHGGTDTGSPGDDCRAGAGSNLVIKCEIIDNPAHLTVAPPSHDFGVVATGTTSTPQTITLTNTGGTFTGPITIVHGDPVDFPISSDTCTGIALAAGASCTVDFAFSPSTTGPFSADPQFSGTPGGATSTSLDGTGANPANVVISPPSHDFLTAPSGTTSPAQTFTVTNTGGVPTGALLIARSGTNADQFATSNDTCDGQVLDAGASCTLDAAFAPTGTGPKTANLDVLAAPGGTSSASLSGTGINPAFLVISPAPHDFGAVATGTTGGAQQFTVTNTGDAPSGTITTALVDPDAGQFTKSNDTCDGVTLNASASCTIDAAFVPTSNGDKSASLEATAAPGGTASATLTGTGVDQAVFSISPSPHDFGGVVNGSTSSPQTFTVTNVGGVPSGTITVSKFGGSTALFPVSNDTCTGATLTAGSSCTVDAAFAPDSAGFRTTLLQATATPGGNANSELSGTGQNPANLTIAPSSHDFGNVLVGTSSPAHTFTITNTGDVGTGLITSGITGLDSTQFTQSSNTCPNFLGAGAQCTIGVTFTPTSANDMAAFLEVGASPGGNPSATLTGKGVATAANLQIGISSGSGTTPTYGSSAARDVGSLPGGAGSTVYVWLKNVGEADARISNSPVPINRVNATAELFAPGFATCKVSGGLGATVIPFSDPVIVGNSPGCYFPMRVADATGPFSVSFTITGSPGGSVTATITGTN